MAGRHHYTHAGFAAMKEGLARALIDMRLRATDVFEGDTAVLYGSPGEGWTGLSSDGTFRYRLPPVPGRSGATGELPVAFNADNNEPYPPSVIDVHEVMYKPWFDRVDAAFEGWDELPDERDFWARSKSLSHGGYHLRQQRYTAEVNVDVGPLNETLRISLDEIDNLLNRGDSNGRAIEAFRTGYVLPLPGLLAQQHTLLVALSQLIRAEGDIWHEARTKVMEIGEGATNSASVEEGDNGATRTVLSVIGIVAGVAANMPGPQAIPAALLSGGIALIDELWPGEEEAQDPVPREFAAETPEGVLDRVVDALNTLNGQIDHEETAVTNLAVRLEDASRKRSTISAADDDPETPVKYNIFFDLPSPVILQETDKVDLAINPDTLGYVANDHLPTVANALANTAAQVDHVELAQHAWTRPHFIGSGGTGPYTKCEDLRQRVIDVLTNTGGEVVAASDHLLLARGLIVRSDDAAQQALDAHAREVAEQGLPKPRVTDAPDPVPSTELPTAPDQQDPSERLVPR